MPPIAAMGRALLVSLALLIILPGLALAGEAAVVVRHGDGSTTFALVSFPEEEITSFELLDRSTLSLTTVAFGGLGEAVCTLDGEGCPVSDCQRRLCQTGDPESPFWQFFRPGADGFLVSQPLGASASRVSDGGVDVWSWTGSEANVPPMALSDIAAKLGISIETLSDGDVVVARFDAAGNRITSTDDEGPASDEVVIGAAALLLLAATGLMLARRRSAAANGQASA